MAEGDPFINDLISMPAFGRNLNLCDLYNYRDESIVNGELLFHLLWH